MYDTILDIVVKFHCKKKRKIVSNMYNCDSFYTASMIFKITLNAKIEY